MPRFATFLSVFWMLIGVCELYGHYQHGRRAAAHAHVRSKRQTGVQCDPNSKFSTIDGTCNNLAHVTWGSAGEPLARLIYSSSQSVPRLTDSKGNDLPSARKVSVAYHPPSEALGDITLMVMQFGQFLDHDLTLSEEHHLPEDVVDCCEYENSTACMNIPLTDDPFFTDRSCMPFIRSTRTLDTDVGSDENTNLLTSYIDASMIYGSSDDDLVKLRGENGLLLDRSFEDKGDYLPEGPSERCVEGEGEWCFLAGDIRVNEQSGLAAIHTVFMRQHNRIAKRLRQNNADWSDDTIFHETRKIMIAIFQRITYSEFLPIVLGPTAMSFFQLSEGVYAYQNISANIINSFATAAYRFGHSLIPEELKVAGVDVQFEDLFGSPTLVLNSMDKLSETLCEQDAMSSDRFFSHSVTQHLFEGAVKGSGFDLVARNIQRGRDHSLPPINEFRSVCGIERLNGLKDLFPDLKKEDHVYDSIDDVDLFTGGMAETPVEGGLVGPTFACILSTQFNRLKHGDRFFYEHKGQPTSFTDDQINEINKITLAKVICETTENQNVQRNIFKPISRSNRAVPCNEIPDIDLDKWRRTGAGNGEGGNNGGGNNGGGNNGGGNNGGGNNGGGNNGGGNNGGGNNGGGRGGRGGRGNRG